MQQTQVSKAGERTQNSGAQFAHRSSQSMTEAELTERWESLQRFLAEIESND